MRILIVEDERGIANGLQGLLEKMGYAVDVVRRGDTGLDYALSNIYDLMILDVMLPGMDGLSLLREVRSEGIDTPVLLLTAKSEIQDRVQGLDCGADDYLTKPFAPEELLARVRALTRRKDRPLEEKDLSFGDLVLDRTKMELCSGENRIRLSPKEYQIMEIFLNSKQRPVDRQLLFERVWGMLSEAEYNNVEVYITFLRRKLRSLRSKVAIRSLRSVGYYLEVEE